MTKKFIIPKLNILKIILVYIKGMALPRDSWRELPLIFFHIVNLSKWIKLIILPSKYIQCSSKNGIRSFLPRNDHLHRKLSMVILVTHRRGQSHLYLHRASSSNTLVYLEHITVYLHCRKAAINFSIARKSSRETSRARARSISRTSELHPCQSPSPPPLHAKEILKFPASPRTRKVSLIESDLYPHALRLISAQRLILISR